MHRREWLEGSYSYLLNWNARCPGGFNRGTACGCAFCTIQELGASLDEEALGEHVTVAPLVTRSLIMLRFSLEYPFIVLQKLRRDQRVFMKHDAIIESEDAFELACSS